MNEVWLQKRQPKKLTTSLEEPMPGLDTFRLANASTAPENLSLRSCPTEQNRKSTSEINLHVSARFQFQNSERGKHTI